MASIRDTWGRAASLSWRDVMRTEPSRLRAAVARMPEEEWSSDPAALLGVAASFRVPGASNPYAAEPYLDAADELLAADASDPALRILAAVVRSVPLRPVSTGQLRWSA